MHRRESETWGSLTEDDVRQGTAHYYAYCEQVDEQIGRILDALDAGGQAEDTFVAFTSDHGDMMGAHRMWIKSWMPYEEIYRMPLVIRMPGSAAGACDHLVQTHDIPHTFLDLLGLPALSLRLDKVRPGENEGEGFRSLFVSAAAGKTISTLESRPFNPISVGGYRIHQKEQGRSPRLRLIDGGGREVFNAFVALRARAAKEEPGYEDFFTIPESGYRIDVSMGPREASPSGVRVTVTGPEEEIFRGSVSLGEPVSVGAYTLGLDEVRNWASFRVVRDKGQLPLFLGFLLGITGIGLRVFSTCRWVTVLIEPDKAGALVTVTGWAEREEALLGEEIAMLIVELKGDDPLPLAGKAWQGRGHRAPRGGRPVKAEGIDL